MHDTDTPADGSASIKKPTAIALVSGGLDSSLAVRMMQEQGVEVTGVHFYTGFCITETQRRSGNPKANNRPNDGLKAGSDLGIEVEIVDISQEYLKIVTQPKHGYGANVNPCIDCRSMMIKKAGEIMRERGADMVVTGEVLGQRPMSQNRKAMDVINGESELDGRLVRPLSARNLPKTEPEREHLIDRDKLGNISGRSRKPQMAMARDLGVDDYLQPAGGCCFLTDENFARKFRDLFAYEPDAELNHDQIMLLTVGRHFRLPGGAKLVVGRDAGENGMLQGLVTDERIPAARLMVVEDHKGPLTVICGDDPQDLELAAAITARYSDAPAEVPAPVRLWTPARQPQTDGPLYQVVPAIPDSLDPHRV